MSEKPKYRRIKLVNGTPDLSAVGEHQLVPVDAETGEALEGVVACRIEQRDYGSLPVLVIEVIEFDANVIGTVKP